MDVKELIIAGAEAAKNIGLGQLIWAGELDNKAWKTAFERVAECRKKCLETMSNPRVCYCISKKDTIIMLLTSLSLALRRRHCLSVLASKCSIMDYIDELF